MNFRKWVMRGVDVEWFDKLGGFLVFVSMTMISMHSAFCTPASSAYPTLGVACKSGNHGIRQTHVIWRLRNNLWGSRSARDHGSTRRPCLRVYRLRFVHASPLTNQGSRFHEFAHFEVVVDRSQQSGDRCVGDERQGTDRVDHPERGSQPKSKPAEKKPLRRPRPRRFFESRDKDEGSGDGS